MDAEELVFLFSFLVFLRLDEVNELFGYVVSSLFNEILDYVRLPIRA